MDTEQVTSQVQSLSLPTQKSVSADDLLEMYDEEATTVDKEVKQEVEKQAKIAQELPKKIVANKVVKNLESKKDSYEEDLRTGSEGESQEKEKEVVDELKPNVPIAAFKAKIGDKEVEIPEEATISQTINGKPFQIKVKDAVKALVGQEEWNRKLDQRISYVANREKQHQQEVSVVQERFKELVEKAETGDTIGALNTLAEMSGKDPVEFEKSFLDTLTKVSEVYGKMSDEQRRAYFAERKADHLSKKLKSAELTSKTQAEVQAIQREVLSLCKQNNLTEEQFVDYVKDLVHNYNVDPKDLTPNDVITHHKEIKHAEKVGRAIGKIDPKLAQDASLVEELILSTKDNPEFTEDDIATIVEQIMSVDTKSVENLKRKVEKANSNGFRAQPPKASSGKEDAKERNLEDEAYDFFFGKAKLSPRR